MKNLEFKEKARGHQVEFKRKRLGLDSKRSPEVTVRRFNKDTGAYEEREITVTSMLMDDDLRDSEGGYVIFCPGFRAEITREVERVAGPTRGQLVSNLLRSEHIPYNVFFPLRKDPEGTARLFNAVLKEPRIARVDDIRIEYNPGGLGDRTSFDVFLLYTSVQGKRGGIGIEVKYTEKEYPLKRDSKEWADTHNASGIHLAASYRAASAESGWFREEAVRDVPAADRNGRRRHVVANRFRQIWRNQILGASMVLGMCADPADRLDEFLSLTVYPADNGHFGPELWEDYEKLLTDAGKETIRRCSYEELFPLMGECLDQERIPGLDGWIAYLRERYLIGEAL